MQDENNVVYYQSAKKREKVAVDMVFFRRLQKLLPIIIPGFLSPGALGTNRHT